MEWCERCSPHRVEKVVAGSIRSTVSVKANVSNYTYYDGILSNGNFRLIKYTVRKLEMFASLRYVCQIEVQMEIE